MKLAPPDVGIDARSNGEGWRARGEAKSFARKVLGSGEQRYNANEQRRGGEKRSERFSKKKCTGKSRKHKRDKEQEK
jgi:hypothetical protein